MKKGLLFILLLLFIIPVVTQSQPKFNVKFSEQLAVYEFVKNLSGYYPTNSFKETFTKSEYNQEKYKKLIGVFDNLQIHQSFQYQGYPYGQKIPVMATNLLRHNLIESKSLEEFKHLSIGIIPNAELIQLTLILSEFKPVYQELIYKPNKEKFESQLKELSTFVGSKNIASYFEKGLTFYHASWDNSIPFEIALLPKPDSNGFSAEAILNNAVSEIPGGFNDFNVLMSVLLHEIYHIVYDEQSLDLKLQIEQWFGANNSRNSQYAYLLFNEALATSLGNGYTYEQLSGTIDKGDWYTVKYVNLMAKKIYPLVQSYVQQQKAIDKNFVDEYVKVYDENFSVWLSELDHVLTYRFVMAENREDVNFINRNYGYCSISEAQYPTSESGIERMKEIPITKVIIVSSQNRAKLELIKKCFPELKEWKFNSATEFVYSRLLKDKTHLIIINKINTPAEDLFNKIFKRGIIK
ncbi:MAG: hypothetical protein WBP45_10430 [Daejeonella sp.]